ncbi:MAG: signal peptidase II [Agathobacter sp.]|nr:signal peptidase II [Agathobacter sp.]
MKAKSKKQILRGLTLVNILIILDQLTKDFAVNFLKNQNDIPIIKDIFELKYLENTSAAFGMDPVSLLQKLFQFEVFKNDPQLFLDVRMGFFYIITICVCIFLIYLYTKIPAMKKYIYMDYVLLFFVAGAIGNLIDRIRLKYVVDFFYFKLIDFPIFNVADIYVTCAAFAMIALGLFYYKDEDIDAIFPSKKKS